MAGSIAILPSRNSMRSLVIEIHAHANFALIPTDDAFSDPLRRHTIQLDFGLGSQGDERLFALLRQVIQLGELGLVLLNDDGFYQVATAYSAAI
jgi:hypothetical protein